jgi:hypothetical protein
VALGRKQLSAFEVAEFEVAEETGRELNTRQTISLALGLAQRFVESLPLP